MSLDIESITSGYIKDVPILHNVTMKAEDGALTLIIGPNGAGKSTILRTVYGYLYPTDGDIHHNGKSLKGYKPNQMLGEGIAFLLQGHSVFPDMTVEENLSLGGWLFKKDKKALQSAIEAVFDRYPALKEKRGALAGALSGGQQRILEIARLTMTNPHTILIDEPSVGLMPKLVHSVYAEITKLKEAGYTILMVDQQVRLGLDIADYLYVLNLGENSHHGPKEQFTDTIEDVIKEWI